MMKLEIDWKRVARLGGFVIALAPLITVFFIAGLAWVYVRGGLFAGCAGQFTSLAEYGYPAEPVSIQATDGLTLDGWYTPGTQHPEIAIIVLHGIHSNTQNALHDARMLAEAGYSTLVYEHRTCTGPDVPASTGPHEARDVRGAVEYLKSRGDVQHIGALGFSEGGTAILLAAPDTPALEAVVAMGGYASLRSDVLEVNKQRQNIFERLLRRFVLLWMRVYGIRTADAAPVDNIDRISPRPLLLIYGEYEAHNGLALYNAAQEPKSLWIVDDVGHGNYWIVAPEAYRERILTFFGSAFTLDSPQ